MLFFVPVVCIYGDWETLGDFFSKRPIERIRTKYLTGSLVSRYLCLFGFVFHLPCMFVIFWLNDSLVCRSPFIIYNYEDSSF